MRIGKPAVSLSRAGAARRRAGTIRHAQARDHALSTALLALALALAAAVAPAAEPAGTAEIVRGAVTATTDDGRTRSLSEGADIYPHERLATGRDGLLLVRFRDDTTFTLGRNSEMDVEDFAYDGDEPGITTRVLRGTFRFVSGLIARQRPSAMRVRLAATATIGIRGTHVGGEIEGEKATVVLLEPEADKAGEPSAITVANAHGSVDIEEPGYGTTVPDADSPPSPPRRMKLRSVENLMRSLQSVRRGVSAPRPRMHSH